MQIAITLGVMCFILTCGIVIQLNTIKNATLSVGTSFEENELRDQVLRWKDKYDATYADLEKMQKELEKQRQEASRRSDNSTNLEEELKLNHILLGETEVSGQGVIVKLEDSIDLVHDIDLITVISELKNAGAEAICVNNQRIVSTTAITCDGNVILINGEKIGTPFTILAIRTCRKFNGSISKTKGVYRIIK